MRGGKRREGKEMMASPFSSENVWAKAKIDSLFFHWLSSEQGSGFIKTLTDDVKSGISSLSSSSNNASSPSSVGDGSSPSRLGRKLAVETAPSAAATANSNIESSDSPSSRRYVQRKKSANAISSSLSPLSGTTTAAGTVAGTGAQKTLPRVPTFYAPPGSGKKISSKMSKDDDLLEKRLPEIQEVFKNKGPEGINAEELLPICKNILQFPSALNVPLFRRIRALNRLWRGEPISPLFEAAQASILLAEESPKLPYNPAWLNQPEEEMLIELETGTITQEELIEFWKREVEPFDRHQRFFRLVKQPNSKYIKAKDFFPFVRELIDGHPGLEFLESTPEFQEKYARTVVARIMHRVNSSWTGEITSRELRRSDLLHFFSIADDEEEINAINEYFSYEHFYVIYCKFWELDSDHDFLLSKEDLFRHGGHSLTKLIVDRIFQQPYRSFTSGVKGKMGFEDFCFFILCEEDKTNVTSIRYWFSLVDLDGDGYIRQWEVKMFYDEQLRRMRSLGHEEVPLNDVLCQMKDCLGRITGRSILFPITDDDIDMDEEKKMGDSDDWVIGISEFLKPDRLSISGSFFNLLFNLNKFVASESRDPFSTRLLQGEQPLTDWDRYALTEYSRLASAEEARGGGGGGSGGTNNNAYSTANANINITTDEITSRILNASDSDDESDEVDDDDDQDDDQLASRSSEESGDFHTKGLSPKSSIFSGNGIYNRPIDNPEEEGENTSEDGAEPIGSRANFSKIQYPLGDEALRLPESRFNVSSLWL